jgi:hypothetical protein
MDCTRYENCSDPKEIKIDLNDNELHTIALGCWGVYCDQGKYTIAKYKKGKIETSTVTRGQRSVAEALIAYTKKHRTTDMYLTGDNIYQLGIEGTEAKDVAEFVSKKVPGPGRDPINNFDMDIQIEKGFEKCFKKAEVDRFFLAIGNHDIETCKVLNTQINYKGWKLPSMYYNVFYTLPKFSINILVLDTNMFDDDPTHCDGNMYTEQQKESQKNWAIKLGKKGDWNIVIGHIPFLANGHKKDKHPVVRKDLLSIIDTIRPDIYICADEHNQQCIQYGKTLIVVSGSGGTQLDPIETSLLVPGTIHTDSTFGFVSYKIAKDQISIDFITHEGRTSFSHLIQK